MESANIINGYASFQLKNISNSLLKPEVNGTSQSRFLETVLMPFTPICVCS